ncbi:MAG: hypothetical protein LBF80_01175 [Spirochaetaceae bacterium]|jgi:hypothetical protein|nr:hypothetical protein [Spirochaetaceae bacterium]
MSLSGAVAIPVLDGRGVMYSCGGDWILYAYRVEDAPPTSVEIRYRPQDEYGLGKPPASRFNGNRGLESLLETIGSPETIPFLAGLFRRDPDTRIKASVAPAERALRPPSLTYFVHAARAFGAYTFFTNININALDFF